MRTKEELLNYINETDSRLDFQDMLLEVLIDIRDILAKGIIIRK